MHMWPPFCELRLEKKLFISLYWCLQLTHTLLTPWSSTWNVYQTKKNTDMSHISYAWATRKCIYTHTFSFCFTHIGICLLWKGLLGCLSKRYHLSLCVWCTLITKKRKKAHCQHSEKISKHAKEWKRTLFNSIKQNNGQHKLNHPDNEQNCHGTQKQQNSRRKIRHLKFLPPSHCFHCSSVP